MLKVPKRLHKFPYDQLRAKHWSIKWSANGVMASHRGESNRPGYDCIWDIVFTCACEDKGIDTAHVINNSSLVSDYCVYFKRWPQNCSGFNARKLRPPWLMADLALLGANILWQTRLIYLDSSERREVTTYIQDVFTFDTEWGKWSGV